MPVEIRIHSTPTEISKGLLKQLDPSFMYTFTLFRLYVAYSLAIAFGIFELIPLILGVTSISIRRSMFGRPFARETVGSDLLFSLAILLHLSASIGLVFFLLQHQCAIRIWPIFAICSCLPFGIECAAAIYKTVRQRL